MRMLKPIPERLHLPLILALAAFTRSLGILSRPIWYDEAFAILFSSKGPAAMIYGTLAPATSGTADIHPLGYYTLLWLWIKAFGSSLAATRILSILAGSATVAVTYLFSQEMFNKRFARLTAVVVALAPFPIHYSQEIRMYSFLGLWSMLATYAYVRGSRGDGIKWWLLFTVSAALAQNTHNLAAFYLVPLATTPLLRYDWKNLRAVALAGLGAILLYLPWLIHLPAQFAKISAAYWVERPSADKLLTLLLVYVTNLPIPDEWLFIALFITLTAFAIAILQTLRSVNRDANVLWLFYLSFAPPLLLFFVSQWTPVYVERALLPSGIIFCVWLAWSIFESPPPVLIRNSIVTMLLTASGIGIYQHATYYGFPYAPYRELNESLQDRVEPSDLVLHSSKATRLPSAYYDPDFEQEYVADPPGSGTDTLAPATQKVLGLVASRDVETATAGARRVWFIIFQRHIETYYRNGFANHPHLEWLENEFTLDHVETWGDIRLYLFIQSQAP